MDEVDVRVDSRGINYVSYYQKKMVQFVILGVTLFVKIYSTKSCFIYTCEYYYRLVNLKLVQIFDNHLVSLSIFLSISIFSASVIKCN